jgi:hypothetical protein
MLHEIDCQQENAGGLVSDCSRSEDSAGPKQTASGMF